jgi:hypothetical protein
LATLANLLTKLNKGKQMNNRTKKLAQTLATRISEKKATIARCRLNGNDVGVSVAFTALQRYRRALYKLALLS